MWINKVVITNWTYNSVLQDDDNDSLQDHSNMYKERPNMLILS